MQNIKSLTTSHYKPGVSIRHHLVDEELWFLASDACDIIGLTNVSQVVSRVDDDAKRTYLVLSGNRGYQENLFVSESGLYTVLLSSRAATTKGTEAYNFRRWVTREVIPSIRKTGEYRSENKNVPKHVPVPAAKPVPVDWSVLTGKVGLVTTKGAATPEPRAILDPLPDKELEAISLRLAEKG